MTAGPGRPPADAPGAAPAEVPGTSVTVGMDASASGQAQQAVIGQGVQHNHFYGAPAAERPGIELNTLVPPPSVLVGHAGLLADLAAACEAALAGRRSPAVALLHGTGGVGKSALARALADRLAGTFPDARFEVDLFGFTPGGTPREPGEVLAELLRLAGFDGSDVPAGTAGKAQLWRAWLADRRVLLLLDNAREAEQVAPLLPGPASAGRCLVLVTSRHRLTGLDAVVREEVSLLPPDEAVELLLRIAGRSGAEGTGGADEREVLHELARLCGRLPLALRPVGALLADMDPAGLLAVMRSATRPLEQLDDADREAAAAFTVSYDALSADLQAMLRTCVWHPGPNFDAASIAALAGMPAELATVRLVRLLQRSMLTSLPQRRYVFHDLFVAYARRLVAVQDSREAVEQGRHSLYRHLDGVTGTAHALLHGAAAPDSNTGPFDNPDHALVWSHAAFEELCGAARAALGEGWGTGGSLARRTARLLYVDGREERAAALYADILAAAERAGDDAGQGRARTALADIARDRRHYDEAVAGFEEAALLLRRAGDPAGEADALRGLGEVARARGDYALATEHFGQALRCARAADDPAGQGYALTGLAHVARARGEHDRAREGFREAVELQRRADDGIGLAYALRGLGHVTRAAGELDEATGYFREAVTLHRRAGNRFGQAFALNALGAIACEQGRTGDAAAYFGDALVLHRAVNTPAGEAEALAGLGRVALAEGDPERAAAGLREALAVLVRIGDQPRQAAVHGELAALETGAGRLAAAREHYTAAHRLQIALGLTGAAALTEQALRELPA
ncbi:tetratricopeptide repeat protein [Streptomyces sp. NPDC052309]|uniref:ATP-binding protein n=1 Tax=Streptomyces sp. NPDC052309 TaxID=3155421 RepID=UPI003420565B